MTALKLTNIGGFKIRCAHWLRFRCYSPLHLNMWVHTMVELWAWNKPAAVISDRRNSPWDGGERRPSHADRCAGLRRQVVAKTFFETSGHSRKTRKIIRQFYKLMKLAA